MTKKQPSYSEILETLAKNIARYRKARGYTQEDMAEHGFNYRHYQKLESGTYSPNLRTLHRISEVLGISLKDLL